MPSQTNPFADQNLQLITINDFSPGIVRYARSGGGQPLVFSQNTLGSAADCYRCYVRPNLGLYPFPSYQPVMTVQGSDVTLPVCVSIGSMAAMASRGNIYGSVVATVLVQHGGPESFTNFFINRKDIDLTTLGSTNVYGSPANPFTGFPAQTMSWPTMDFAVWQDPTSGLFARTVLTVDPLNNHWVTVRGWNTTTSTAPADQSSGTYPIVASTFNAYPRAFYHENRGYIMQVEIETTAAGFTAADCDTITVSNILSPATWQSAGTVFPEMGTFVGTWGSYSTGELILIYAEGGGVLIYGDILNQNVQVIKLPGITGCDAIGKAALSRSGMIYSTATHGVHMWNGDNTSQFISNQLPEDEFIRNKQPPPFSQSPIWNSSSYPWAHWVMFPNNWVFDTNTNSWWVSENTNIMRFNVYADNGGHEGADGFLYASPGVATAPANSAAVVTVYAFSEGNPSSSYFWLSNPIPVTVGALVSLEWVELNASNTTATAATVTIQPQSMGANVQFQNTTQAQPVVFSIPPNTSNYRAAQRLGFTDYNIQIALTSVNSNANNGAPVIHSINLGYTSTRPSNV